MKRRDISLCVESAACRLCLAVAFVLLAGCQGGNRSGDTLFAPASSGHPFDVLVVADEDLWQRRAGRALADVLATRMPGLPQPEPSFRVMHASPAHFDATLKRVRNIVVADVRSGCTQAALSTAGNVNASPQSVLLIEAPDETSFGQCVQDNRQQIVDYFVRAEMDRQVQALERDHNAYVESRVRKLFDCTVWVPCGLSACKEGTSFFWAGTNAAMRDQNFVVYSYPYTDRATFTKDNFVDKRDSVMKANIPGARRGMYMTTDRSTVTTRPIAVQGSFAYEARGLWRVEGDCMGGPFVSHARVDTLHGRVVVAEAFVYSPGTPKRDLVRQLEASLYTLRLPGGEAAARDDGAGADGSPVLAQRSAIAGVYLCPSGGRPLPGSWQTVAPGRLGLAQEKD